MTIRTFGHRAFRGPLLSAVVLILLVGGVASAAPASALTAVPTIVNGVRLNPIEAGLLARINDARAHRGLAVLQVAPGYTDVARRWAANQASRNVMSHNPNLRTQLVASGGRDWRVLGENVGHGSAADSLFTAYWNSPAHRANILNPSYRYIGMGWVTRADGTGYNTQNFVSSYEASYGPCRVAMVR